MLGADVQNINKNLWRDIIIKGAVCTYVNWIYLLPACLLIWIPIISLWQYLLQYISILGLLSGRPTTGERKDEKIKE